MAEVFPRASRGAVIFSNSSPLPFTQLWPPSFPGNSAFARRLSLVEARAREVNRVQKVLEGANIKLSSVATDVLGKSGRAMLEALIAGEQDPIVLAELARGRMRVVSARIAPGPRWAIAGTAADLAPAA